MIERNGQWLEIEAWLKARINTHTAECIHPDTPDRRRQDLAVAIVELQELMKLPQSQRDEAAATARTTAAAANAKALSGGY